MSDYKQKNKLRVAAVWMDDYARYVSGFDSAKGADHGDVSERVALRRRLNCRSFQWCAATLRRATYAGRPSELTRPHRYLDNVYPEHPLPDHPTGFALRSPHKNSNWCALQPPPPPPPAAAAAATTTTTESQVHRLAWTRRWPSWPVQLPLRRR